ncbi:MAG: acylphosphatase [Fimbriimonadaceae bacterium]
MATWHFLVSGRIQGVGFRAYVQREAQELRIDGEVWNRGDGKVEIIAISKEESKLNDLEQRLADGPGDADEIKRSEIDDLNGQFSGFSIGPTR